MTTHTSPHNNIIRNWLYFNAFMVFCMAVIGAVTRLTESGLSIVEWRPLIGALPPLNAAEWERVFALYRETPEYQKVNVGMSLSEFKNIFFWEWFHRLWGRLIGLFYAVPLVFFWIKNWIPNGYKSLLFGLLILGAMQGVMGYIMVLSGLVDQPSVSHYRLAAHLSLAFVIFACLLWVGFSLSNIAKRETSFCIKRHGWVSMALLSITIIWGAFMAGMDAGLVSSSWPHMYQGIIIPNGLLNDFFNNAETIHFTHRWLAMVTMITIIAFAWLVKSHGLAHMVILQFGLGIATIMTHVHIHTAATHQAGAFILTGLLLRKLYQLR
jgi:cytochrome c oxidase assembly protein subunit 15